jgi:hypothetical protein
MPLTTGFRRPGFSLGPGHADLPDMQARWPWLALLLLGACADADPGAAAAAQAFAAFQQALHRQDENACRQLLTVESAAVLADMPWHKVREQQPLEVLGAEGSGSRFYVDIADPNTDGRRSQFVVVREFGRLVVDLVASAGLHTEVVEASANPDDYEARELTPADFDRIREHELAQPPR